MSRSDSGATLRETSDGEAGRSCPYCRFPLKPGSEAAICPGCRAVHHGECWSDNGGCAVVGCSHVPTTRPTMPYAQPLDAPTLARPPVAPPPPPPPSPLGDLQVGRGSRPGGGHALTAAVIVLAVAVAGAAAALLLQNKGGPSAPAVQAGSAAASSSGATATDSTPGQASAASTPGPSTPAPPVGPPSLAPYTGQGFTLSYPAGWVTDRRELSQGSYVESHWHLPGRPDVSLLIDHTLGVTGSAKEGADGVRTGTANETGYQELSYAPESLRPGAAQVWRFILGGKERIDTFYTLCGTGYAILGAAPVAAFSQYEATFADVSQSLVPGACGTR